MSIRLRRPATADADASGNLTLTFGPVDSGRMWTGTISIVSAPSGATWAVQAGGFTIGSSSGAGPFGPVQATESEYITVTGKGFTAGASYTATLVGSDDEKGSQPWLSPATTNVTIGGGSSGGATTTIANLASYIGSGAGLTSFDLTLTPESTSNAFFLLVAIQVAGTNTGPVVSNVSGSGLTAKKLAAVPAPYSTTAYADAEIWQVTGLAAGANTVTVTLNSAMPGGQSGIAIALLELAGIKGTPGTAVTSVNTGTVTVNTTKGLPVLFAEAAAYVSSGYNPVAQPPPSVMALAGLAGADGVCFSLGIGINPAGGSVAYTWQFTLGATALAAVPLTA